MSSTMISRQILSCLLLALLSQYADAKKSQYMESILTSLQSIENMLVKQAEQNTLNCFVPAELFSLFAENQISSNESNETKPNGPNSVIRRALDLHNDIQQLSIPKKQRRKNRNRNANMNTNINENINENTNYHANRYHRRAFDDTDPHLFHNQNKNSNVNFNSNLNRNREDIYRSSEEDDEV